MLSTLAAAPVSLLSLGVRQHGVLLNGQGKEVQACLERADWTCHICGIRIPEMMEIDHTAGHSPKAVNGYRPICQFCHNLKHPLWAAARGRIIPIIAPGLGQIDLHRLAWTMLAQRGAKNAAVDVTGALEDIEYRRQLFVEIYGAEKIEAFLEAILDLPRVVGRDRAAKVVMAIDEQVRFWPAELTDGANGLAPAARLSTWRSGGFRKATNTAARLLNEASPIEGDALRTALASISDLDLTEPDDEPEEAAADDDKPTGEEETAHDATDDLLKDFPLD